MACRPRFPVWQASCRRRCSPASFPRRGYSQYVLVLAVTAAASALNSSVSMSVLRLFPFAGRAGEGRPSFSRRGYSQYVLVLAVIAAASALNSSVSMSVLRLFPVAEKAGEGRLFFRRSIRLALLSGAFIALVIAGAGLFGGFRIGEGFGRLLVLAAVVFMVTECVNVLLSFARIGGLSTAYLSFKAWQAGAALVAGVIAIALLHAGPLGAIAGIGLALALGLPVLWRAVASATCFSAR